MLTPDGNRRVLSSQVGFKSMGWEPGEHADEIESKARCRSAAGYQNLNDAEAEKDRL